eukprot:INCI15687.1.p1 GENE.INCI15687.1~~INCI15687.1.p1  ORF type:complete len:192 (+),score=42.20 INCI15687.1:131-706(+)
MPKKPKKYQYQQNASRIYSRHDTRKLTPVERLSPDELAEIKEAFNLFDVDLSGYIELEELNCALLSLGVNRTPEAVNRLLVQINAQHNKGLSLKKFIELVATVNLGSSVERDEVRDAYRLFGSVEDDEGNPKISLRNLRNAFLEIGENISDRKLHLMIREAETQAQAAVDHEELLKLVKTTSLFYDPLKDR